MKKDDLKILVDTCFLAKKIVETLPDLPKGMKPRHIHVLEIIYNMQQSGKSCRTSDISRELNITMPSVTCLIRELLSLSMIIKTPDPKDGRASLLTLSNEGLDCVNTHVINFHKIWASSIDDVSTDDVQKVKEILTQLWTKMPK